MLIDLHTHSTTSDGTDSPTKVVDNAQRVGLGVIALTDHDTFDGLDEARARGERLALRVLNGLEMSTTRLGHEVHVLGYGCRHDEPALQDELTRLRQGRSGRIAAMCERLSAMGMLITEAEVLAQAAGAPSVGRPHVADVLVNKGYVVDRRQAFDQYLADDKPGFVPRYYTPLEAAIDLIQGAGGAAVLAHAWGRGGREVLPVEVIEALVRDHGLDGIEVDHQDHDQTVRATLGALADDLGLIKTGSSDYHGWGKTNFDLGCNTTAEDQLGRLLTVIGERGGHE